MQTEDSGARKPHITTHVFLRGSIVATKRTEYAPDLPVEQVQQILEVQHRTVLLQLKDGAFDGQIDLVASPASGAAQPPPAATHATPAPASDPRSIIQKFQLQRLDEPGATVATTQPYNPVMSHLAELAGVETNREARSAAVIDREAPQPLRLIVDREARSAAVIDREARSAAVIDREARSAAVIDREARSAAVIDIAQRSGAPFIDDAPRGLAQPVRPPDPVAELGPGPEIEVEIDAEPASADEVSWEATGDQQGSSAGSRRGPQQRSSSQETPARTRPPASITRHNVAIGQGGVIIVHPQPVRDASSQSSTQSAPDLTPPPGVTESGTSGRREFRRESTRVRLPGSGIFRAPPARPVGEPSAYQPHPTAEGVVIQRPLGLVDRTKPGVERSTRGATVPKAGTDPRLPPMATDERSLDEVILAYLAEDLHSKKLP